MRRFGVFALTIAVLAAAPCLGDDPIERGPAREPKPYRYDPKILAALPKPFLEDFPAVTLYSATSYIVEADGTLETTSHEITRFNGRKGIDSYGEFRGASFDPTFQKLVLNEARVIKKDGRSVPVEARHMQLRDSGTDFQVYDQEKQLVISFPNLEVGDAYEVKWTVRGRNKEFAGHFFTRYTFGDDQVPLALDEMHVVLPKGKAFHHKTINGKTDFNMTVLKDAKHYQWQARELWPMPKEEERPSRELLRLRVACSTFPDWLAVVEWKEALRKDCWECTEDVRKVVREVTKGLTNPRDKAKALTYWVRQNIRYLSHGPAGTGYTPHKPHQVLDNLFGDCKDQAQLLAVMLREVGLDPYLVTLGVLDDGQVLEDVPCPWGTHGILMVPIEGKEHWIDTTVTMAPWDWLPRSDRDRMTYLTRRGEIDLKRTPAYTALDNRIEQTTVVAVQGDGSIQCRRSMFYHGGVALGRRESWVEATPGERRRYLTSELQDAFPRCRLETIDIPEATLLDWEKPVQGQVTFVVPRHFIGDSAKEGSVTDSAVWGRIIAYNLDADRKLALNLGSPFESLHYYVVSLPPAFRFDGLPRDKEIVSPFGTFRLKVQPDRANPRRLELVMHTKLTETMVNPDAFSKFQKFHDELSRDYRVWLNIRPTTEMEDAPLLETLLALAPGSDPFAARTLAKLYMENDKRDEARRVLDQACLYHGEDQGLWDLRVKAARDLADTEALHENLVRYFPTETKYALALGGARVNRSNFAGAREVLAPLTRHSTRDVRALAWLEMSRLCARQNLDGPALLHFEAAWHADQVAVASGDSMFFLAKLHEKRGNLDDAVKYFRLAHKLDPDNAELLATVIRIEIKTGRTYEALDHLRRLVLNADGSITRLVQAGELYYELGRFDDAMELAERARDLGFLGRVQRLLGLLYFQKGNHDKAIFHLERGDSDALVLECLMRAHVWRGELLEAYRHVEAAGRLSSVPPSLKTWVDELKSLAKEYKQLLLLRPDPGMPATPEMQRTVNFYLAADLALRKKQPREMVKHLLDKAFEERIELAPALGLRALLCLEQGQLRKAGDDLDKAFRLAPGDARAFHARGRLRLERSQPGAVEDLARAAALSDNNDPHILHWLAAALHQAGKTEEALLAQRRAAQLRPGDPEITAQLALLEAAKRP